MRPLRRPLQRDGTFRAISADGSLALFGDRPPVVLDTATGKTIYALHAGDGREPRTGVLGSPGTSPTPRGATPCSGPGARVHGFETVLPCRALPAARRCRLVDGRVIVVDESDTVTVTDPRPRGEAAEVRTCRGFYCRRATARSSARWPSWGPTCDAGDNLLYGIDLTRAGGRLDGFGPDGPAPRAVGRWDARGAPDLRHHGHRDRRRRDRQAARIARWDLHLR